MRPLRILAVAVLAIILSGCAGAITNLGGPAQFPQLSAFLDSVATMTLPDLQHADAIAMSRVHPEDGTPWPDMWAHDCYVDGFIPFVTKQQEILNAAGTPNPDLTVVGAISRFQQLRNGVKTGMSIAHTPIFPPYVIKACGPYALDILNDANAVGLKIGSGGLLGG